jgi:hypothetical protein
MISIISGPSNKPSIIRACGNAASSSGQPYGSIILEKGNAAHDDNYLYTGQGCGGRYTSTIQGVPIPTNHFNSFTQASNQEKCLPKLKSDKAAPDPSTIANTLDGGTYVVYYLSKNDITAGGYTNISATAASSVTNYPKVIYYPDADKTKLVGKDASGKDVLNSYTATSPVDVTDTFAKHLNDGKISWDYNLMKLTFNQSFKVEPKTISSTSSVNGLIFRTFPGERLTVQVGPTPVTGVTPPAVCLLNKNTNSAGSVGGSSIIVSGQLSGNGSIMCNGDLEMEAESQLAQNLGMGVSVYAKGDVTVNAMQEEPHIDNPNISGIAAVNEERVVAGKIANPAFSCNQLNLQPTNIAGKIYTYKGISYLDQSSFTTAEWNRIKGMLNDSTNAVLVGPGTGQEFYSLMYKSGTSNIYTYYGFSLANGKESIVLTNSTFSDTLYVAKNASSYIANPPGTYLTFNSAAMPAGYIKNIIDMITVKTNQTTYQDKFMYDINAINASDPNTGRMINRKDSVFRGLIYACKNFKVASPDNAFKLEGALVAYGSDPDTGNSNGSRGDITIEAKDITIMHDPKYINVLGTMGDCTVRTLYWAAYNN